MGTSHSSSYLTCKGSKKEISVVVAHLKSGEDYKHELERVTQLSGIFEYLKNFPSTVILM